VREHTGTGVAIAGVIVVFMTSFAAVLAVLVWLALTIYALVKWIGSAPDAPSATTIVLLLISLVTLLAVALAGTITLVGRSMTPRRRRARDRDHHADLEAAPGL
jgi:hypothetical protein